MVLCASQYMGYALIRSVLLTRLLTALSADMCNSDVESVEYCAKHGSDSHCTEYSSMFRFQ